MATQWLPTAKETQVHFFYFAKFWKIRNDFILQHYQHHYHLQNHLPLDSHTLFPNIIFVPFFFAYNLYIPFYAIE